MVLYLVAQSRPGTEGEHVLLSSEGGFVVVSSVEDILTSALAPPITRFCDTEELKISRAEIKSIIII